jgi:hypothetical protein
MAGYSITWAHLDRNKINFFTFHSKPEKNICPLMHLKRTSPTI